MANKTIRFYDTGNSEYVDVRAYEISTGIFALAVGQAPTVTPLDLASPTLTVGSSVVGLGTMPSGCNKVTIEVTSGDIRYRICKTSTTPEPTISTGRYAAMGDTIDLFGGEIAAFKVTQANGTGATLEIYPCEVK